MWRGFGPPLLRMGSKTKLGALGRAVGVMTIAAAATTPGTAHAQFYGMLAACIGANNCGMAGAGVALPLDASHGIVNPSGIARLGNEYYISPGWLSAHRKVGPAGNPAVVNQNDFLNSAKNNFPLFSGGVTKRLRSDLAIGFMISGIGGIGSKFQEGRTVPGEAGGYDRKLMYALAHLMPTVAWSPQRNLSVGLSGILGFARLRTDAATATLARPAKGNRQDIAFGLGAKVGALWDIDERFSVGGSFQSPVWFQEFKKYRDLLIGSLDTPWQAQVGGVWRALPTTDLTLDLRYIGYSHVKVIGRTPEAGGFGWDDVKAVAVGAQHRIGEKWTTRAGFSVSTSPIPKENLFANAFTAAVVQKAVTGGLSYEISDNTEIGFSGEFMFRENKTNDGSGDAISQLSAGTHAQSYFYGINLGLRRQF
jgi:long-chain fatty acid transport protein